ncbi:MAG: tRNA (N(6)-L-threonylcarbamoyladenosine(37)-C(2))-methylthiotransferase MtaB [Oscillospiraceae bacterium]|nr:tRNA (N(6)-L-threonylcarbamoyladenosine(37)-C(2))-methylthiotransferase MtaB [Oscillospiraceae bacterium]
MNTAAFYTLGCKVNQAETRRLADALRARGWRIAAPEDGAGVYIINSCAVTAESARKTRQAVRRFKKADPEATIVLIGCLPSVAEKLAETLPEADIILRQDEKEHLADVLSQLTINNEKSTPIDEESTLVGVRAAVKIQDGCDRFCSYCVIPLARGRARSVPQDAVLDECRGLITRGARELILTGINLCAWGKERGETLAAAARAAADLPGLVRLRLGSLEPDLLTAGLAAELAEIDKLCPQFHISLQSGSDAVLRRMNRRYNTAEFAALCENLRRLFPGCTLTTDIIAGFPAETDAEFAETLAFARKMAFEKAHIFPYSARQGTRAAEMAGQLPRAEKELRARALIAAMGEIRRDFLRAQIGKTLTILPEERDREGFLRGCTANYIPVRVGAVSAVRPIPPRFAAENMLDVPNALLPVLITDARDDYCIAEAACE